MRDDWVVWTGRRDGRSDVEEDDASALAARLEDVGLTAYSAGPVVVVVDVMRKSLLREIGMSGLDYGEWEYGRVGDFKEMRRGVRRELGSGRAGDQPAEWVRSVKRGWAH